jgi:hypothetical protein
MICSYCDEEILPDEIDGDYDWRWHRECLIRATVGSAAHQLHECPCYGGTREDPPGLTLREAAKLAFDCFMAVGPNAAID